jgi:hypothetical protein
MAVIKVEVEEKVVVRDETKAEVKEEKEPVERLEENSKK